LVIIFKVFGRFSAFKNDSEKAIILQFLDIENFSYKLKNKY